MNTKLHIISAICSATLATAIAPLNAATASHALPTIAANPAQPPVYFVQRRFYTEPPRDRVVRDTHDTRGDLGYSMGRLHDSINHMNDVLHQYGRDSYGELKNEIDTFNSQVDAFQKLVDHHESNRTLRDAFTRLEQVAAAIDVHMHQINAASRVNDAWNDVGAAYHRVSDDIDYRSASER